MPYFMDLHFGLENYTREDIEREHLKDVAIQEKYGVKIHKFFYNEKGSAAFCFFEAPDKASCEAVHKEAHGTIASEIIEVDPYDYDNLLGKGKISPLGTALLDNGEVDSALRTIMFTDIVNSTGLTEKFGDQVSMNIVRKHNEIVRSALKKFDGREIKHTGDGIMASFISSSKAVCCAMEMQQRFNEARTGPDMPLNVRIGINAGEPVTEGGDFFGVAVQLSKRICDVAGPDEIYISETVKGLCLGKTLQFQERGEHTFKGFSMPFKIYSVGNGKIT